MCDAKKGGWRLLPNLPPSICVDNNTYQELLSICKCIEKPLIPATVPAQFFLVLHKYAESNYIVLLLKLFTP